MAAQKGLWPGPLAANSAWNLLYIILLNQDGPCWANRWIAQLESRDVTIVDKGFFFFFLTTIVSLLYYKYKSYEWQQLCDCTVMIFTHINQFGNDHCNNKYIKFYRLQYISSKNFVDFSQKGTKLINQTIKYIASFI